LFKFNRNVGSLEDILDSRSEFLTNTVTRNKGDRVLSSILLGKDLCREFRHTPSACIYCFTLFCSAGAGTGMEVAVANERVAIFELLDKEVK
jgi:hypothetical protein